MAGNIPNLIKTRATSAGRLFVSRALADGFQIEPVVKSDTDVGRGRPDSLSWANPVGISLAHFLQPEREFVVLGVAQRKARID